MNLHDHSHPCLHCHQHSYIRMVQHLMEGCLILKMSCDECIKALAHHARISPLVTLTVWRELLKENGDFFQAYFRALSPRPYHSRLMGIPKYHRTGFKRRRRHGNAHTHSSSVTVKIKEEKQY